MGYIITFILLITTAEETVSLPENVLLKIAFRNEGVKEMLTCIPKLDEHLFATATDRDLFHFVQYSKTSAIYFPML